ncbi:MAG: hypothetical protein ABIR39_22150 [Nocardioides sp.]|uniref:hypothetical protein n=1 Tax=Nocardioides sp. TaxID=35761 RepID=UPI003265AF01
MTRMMTLLAMVVLFAACSTSVRPPSEGGDPQAEDLKAEVDAVAKDVVPALTTALGVQPTGLQASFTERGGFGLWDYRASGQFAAPDGTSQELTDTIRRTLTGSGLEVTQDAVGAVVGSKGNASVRLAIVRSVVAGSSKSQQLVDITIGSTQPTTEGDDFAKSAPAEDYLTYLE